MRRRQALRRLAGSAAGPFLGRAARTADAWAPAAPDDCRPEAEGVLRRSDVVFMYEAKPEAYREYGATVLAWGGVPTPAKLQSAAGLAWHGSVGMVTEFEDYFERFPDTWEAALCRDVHGQPMKVPWLTDHQHKGVPYWWCCTRQPQFRQYLEERVVATMKAGAHGVHVDDHLGSAGALFLGACFCGRCVSGFGLHLAALAPARRAELGVADAAAFDYGATLRKWLADCLAGETRRVQEHPTWGEWSKYQLRSAAASMRELRAVAERAAGRRVPVSANAGLLWPHHLADYAALDYLSAETDHAAAALRLSDRPLFAYRLADAVRRPYAATATGQDWAFVKEHGCAGLVTGWVAQSHAAGHRLMAPHRQWCHTPEKGTHWYDGPAAVYAPLYRFVREHAALLDGHEAWSDVTLVMPHAAWVADRDRWLALGAALSAAGLDYRLVLGSDDVVDCPITPDHFAGQRLVLHPAPEALVESDRRAVDTALASKRVVATVEEAARLAAPAVRVSSQAPVRVLTRVGAKTVVAHVLNQAYEADRDHFRPLRGVALHLDRQALGVPARAARGRLLAPGMEPAEVELAADGRLIVDIAGPWALLALERA